MFYHRIHNADKTRTAVMINGAWVDEAKALSENGPEWFEDLEYVDDLPEWATGVDTVIIPLKEKAARK